MAVHISQVPIKMRFSNDYDFSIFAHILVPIFSISNYGSTENQSES